MSVFLARDFRVAKLGHAFRVSSSAGWK
jgi:hypothetical protein